MKGKLNFLNKFLQKVGFELRKYNPRNSESYQLRKILKNNRIELVIDVGANDGGYAKYLRSLGYEGKIISFEPLANPFDKLKKASKEDFNWEIAPRMAIGDYDGKTEINISANSYSSSILDINETHVNAAPESNYVDKETVDINRLDNLIGHILPQYFGNAFLKIDVQGFEKQVLYGAQKLLASIKGIQTEMSLVTLYQDQILYTELIEIMQKNGFELYAIFPGFMDKKTGQLLQFDGIFIKNE